MPKRERCDKNGGGSIKQFSLAQVLLQTIEGLNLIIMRIKFKQQTVRTGVREAQHAQPLLLEFFLGNLPAMGPSIALNNCGLPEVLADKIIPLTKRPNYGWLRFHLKPLT